MELRAGANLYMQHPCHNSYIITFMLLEISYYIYSIC